MKEHLNTVRKCLEGASGILRRLELTDEYRYKLCRHIIGMSEENPSVWLIKQSVLDGVMVMEVAQEQLWHGGWARFGTEDLTVRKKVPTTMFAVRRLIWLGLGPCDEPLARALEYLVGLFDGRRMPPEGGEVNERWPEVLKIRCANLIAMIDPYHPCLDDLMERWRFIAENTFGGGSYQYDVCRELQAMLLHVRGPRLIPIPSQLLAARPGFLPRWLNDALLWDCWQRHLDGFLLWPDGKLDRLPDSFRNNKTSRHMSTMESMVCFGNSSAVLKPAIEWLLAGRGDDGLWDYGPQAKDPAGYPRRLAAGDWRKPMNRKLDCTMEVLMILKNYLDHNTNIERQ